MIQSDLWQLANFSLCCGFACAYSELLERVRSKTKDDSSGKDVRLTWIANEEVPNKDIDFLRHGGTLKTLMLLTSMFTRLCNSCGTAWAVVASAFHACQVERFPCWRLPVCQRRQGLA